MIAPQYQLWKSSDNDSSVSRDFKGISRVNRELRMYYLSPLCLSL